jgi:signal transduction histidine kinase
LKKILIIEDDPDVLDNLTEIVHQFDYQVYPSRNGLDGIRMAIEVKPDLIICDIMMPGIDGYGVLNAMQENESTATIPFVFLTAKSEKDDIRSGMNLGADDYLTKPFTPDQLYKTILSRLKKKDKFEEESEKRLEQLKFNLASMLPHEFRTPLNGILASSQFLLEYFPSLETDEVVQIHENIYESALRLQRHIMNYLLFADIELISKSTVPEQILSQVTNLPLEILSAVFKKCASKSNRNQDLSLNLTLLPPLRISQEHFYKIFEEISDNAFKFSSSGQKVALSAVRIGDQIQFSVMDNGRGMTDEQIAKIGAYVQFDRKIYEQQGSGLGLVIAKKLVELYYGKFKITTVKDQFTLIEISLALAP